MKRRLFIALVLIMMLVPMSIAAADEKPLRFETTYVFMGHLEIQEEEYGTRFLIWQGEVFVRGDQDPVGTMEWWMYFPGGTDTGQVNHWEDAIWKIYFNDGGYIQGNEWGSTTWLHDMTAANWRANGIVTDVSEGYEYLIDRPMHDGGKVTWPPGSLPFGAGKLHINK